MPLDLEREIPESADLPGRLRGKRVTVPPNFTCSHLFVFFHASHVFTLSHTWLKVHIDIHDLTRVRSSFDHVAMETMELNERLIVTWASTEESSGRHLAVKVNEHGDLLIGEAICTPGFLWPAGWNFETMGPWKTPHALQRTLFQASKTMMKYIRYSDHSRHLVAHKTHATFFSWSSLMKKVLAEHLKHKHAQKLVKTHDKKRDAEQEPILEAHCVAVVMREICSGDDVCGGGRLQIMIEGDTVWIAQGRPSKRQQAEARAAAAANHVEHAGPRFIVRPQLALTQHEHAAANPAEHAGTRGEKPYVRI